MKSGLLIGIDQGIETRLHFDDSAQQITLSNTADVQANIDRNIAIRNEGLGQGKNMRLAASIPLHILMDLEKQGITKDPVRFKRWLNDPDNRAWRTSNARI